METKMSDKKLVDFIEEYIDDSELLSELADVQLDDIRLNVERRELELLCSAAAAPGELLLRAVETSLIKAFTLNAAMINCSVTEEKPEETPKEPMSETGLAKPPQTDSLTMRSASCSATRSPCSSRAARML